MISRSIARVILLTVALAAVFMLGACKSDPEPTATPQPSLSAPITFPYVFSGNFTVDGEPGPADVPMFARIGEARGPFNDSVRVGEYINVSITPIDEADYGKEITFHLGHPDGPTVQAEETYVFIESNQPLFLQLDLTFPRMP